MKTYTTTKVKFEEMTKKINRLFKKLDAIGATYDFHIVREFVKEVPVFAHDEHTKYKVDDVLVDYIEYVLDFPQYKVGNYHFGAVVERSADENINLVYCADDNVEDFKKYQNATIRCEHCNTNHVRTKAIILVDNETGSHKMVGTACVKDFIGYNVEQFAKYFCGVEEIMLENEDPEIDFNSLGDYKIYIDTREYLAHCVDIVNKIGYAKTVKTDAYMNMRKKTKINSKSYEKADKIIQFFNDYETDDVFENDVKIFVTGKKPVCYENGFIAYACVLFDKIQERLARDAERAERCENTEYVGTVGYKTTAVGKLQCVGHYDTQFGCVKIYKITDNDGNVFVWKTTKYLEIEDGMTVEITGTIKEHTEYRGEKQNVLTRCKIRECVLA